MGIAAILLLGMGGALTMSMTALDKGNDRNADAVTVAAAADLILVDLNEATEVITRSAGGGAIGIKVPDRDNDGNPESIAYLWTGARGTPLYRSINGGPAVVLLPKVDASAIGLLTRAVPATTSAEQLLSSYDTSIGATIQTIAPTKTRHAAQYIKPAFAANVDSWTVTRIQVRLARDLVVTGTLRVSLVRAVDWEPSGEVLASIDIPEGALPAAANWYDVAVSAGPLLPSEGIFIRLEDTSGLSLGAGTVQYGSGGATMPYNTFYTTSTDSGASWSAPQDSKDMRFKAFGTTTSH